MNAIPERTTVMLPTEAMTIGSPIQMWDGSDTDTGLYAGVRDEEYHAMQGMCSATQLKMLRNGSPQHVAHWLKNTQETPALRIGRAFHAKTLCEPTFGHNFTIAPSLDRRTKAGKEAYATFVAMVSPGQTMLTRVEADLVDDMAAAVRDNGLASDLLADCGEYEVTAFGEVNGVKCRAKMDALDPQCSLLIDLKTTQTLAGRDEMQHVVWKHGYGLQMCFYRELMRANGCNPGAVMIIAVEKKPPFAVACYELQHDLLDMHVPMMNRLIAEWQETIGSNNIRGWSEQVQALSLPRYALDELEIEAQMEESTGGAS